MMKTILVADDDKNVRLLIETELTLEGYKVILANNGLETLKKIKEETPDLLLLDLKMPNMHGLDVIRAIHKNNKKLPIIICTAYEKMMNDYTVENSNIAGYLIKPVDLCHLKEVIKKSLANKRT